MEQKTTKRTAPPRYDEAFKAGAIRLVTEQHRPAKEVAAELGICVDTRVFDNRIKRKEPTGRTRPAIFMSNSMLLYIVLYCNVLYHRKKRRMQYETSFFKIKEC